ncbi:MAG: hypothetical protein ACIALR_05180, partial [Blastopirellula sp. JB062]
MSDASFNPDHSESAFSGTAMSHDHHPEGGSDRPVLLSIGAIILVFVLATIAGLTQPSAAHVADEAAHAETVADAEHHATAHAHA